MFARFFAAVVVVGGRGGTVCACALLLAAVFVCARRWSRPFLDEGAAGGGLHHLVDTLVAVGSDAAAVCPIKIDATREVRRSWPQCHRQRLRRGAVGLSGQSQWGGQ